MLSIVENIRRKQLGWVQAIMASRHWNASQLAEQAGIDHSTLSKFINGKVGTEQLSTRVVECIAHAGGIPPYQTTTPTAQRGFAETEASPYITSPQDPLALAIETFVAGRNGVDTWVLRSRALELAGYLPGDLLVVDMNAEPQAGDVVCVQVYDRSGKAETAFRIYDKPYLVAASSDASLRRPMLLDGDRAVARGVVIASLRPRLSTARAA